MENDLKYTKRSEHKLFNLPVPPVKKIQVSENNGYTNNTKPINYYPGNRLICQLCLYSVKHEHFPSYNIVKF